MTDGGTTGGGGNGVFEKSMRAVPRKVGERDSCLCVSSEGS